MCVWLFLSAEAWGLLTLVWSCAAVSDALQVVSMALFPGAEADPMGGVSTVSVALCRVSTVSVALCHGQILSLVGIA